MSVSVMSESSVSGAGWRELSRSECFGLLARGQVGRVAFVDDLGPVVLPVNFVLDRSMVVFRTDDGSKLDIAVRGHRVAFEIDGSDETARTGWSVVVRGEAVEVTDPAELARLRELPLHPLAPGAKTHYVRILPAMLSGRLISAAGASARQRTSAGAAHGPPATGEDWHGN